MSIGYRPDNRLHLTIFAAHEFRLSLRLVAQLSLTRLLFAYTANVQLFEPQTSIPLQEKMLRATIKQHSFCNFGYPLIASSSKTT